MKVLLIGTGTVGRVLSQFLTKDKDITKIICASNDVNAKKYIYTDKKISLIKLDASKKNNIKTVAKGMDLIINASIPDLNEVILQAALESKTNYLDLCSHLKDLKTPEQLKYNKRFKKAKLTALINTGIAPGITNLLAREIADELDKIDHIKIRLLEEQKSDQFIPSWSVSVTVDELRSPCLNYKEGKFMLTQPFGDPEQWNFPKPYGKRKVMNIYGDEISTLPKYVKTRNIDCKSGGTDIEMAYLLHKLGLFENSQIIYNNQKIIPSEFIMTILPKMPTPEEMNNLVERSVLKDVIFISTVQGSGAFRGKNIIMQKTVTYPNLKKIYQKMHGVTYISYPTGLAVYSFIKIINMMPKGVYPPESLEKNLRLKVLQTLKIHGVTIKTHKIPVQK